MIEYLTVEHNVITAKIYPEAINMVKKFGYFLFCWLTVNSCSTFRFPPPPPPALLFSVSLDLVFNKHVSNIATAYHQNKWLRIRSRIWWTNTGIIVATFAFSLQIISKIFRIIRFSSENRKILHWPAFYASIVGFIWFGRCTWTWLFKINFASHLWKMCDITCLY